MNTLKNLLLILLSTGYLKGFIVIPAPRKYNCPPHYVLQDLHRKGYRAGQHFPIEWNRCHIERSIPQYEPVFMPIWWIQQEISQGRNPSCYRRVDNASRYRQARPTLLAAAMQNRL